MGIQINGNTDTISAGDGSLVVAGAEISTLNVGTGGTAITTTNTGLVGIGTVNPGDKLVVYGPVAIGASNAIDLASSTGARVPLRMVNDNGSLWTGGGMINETYGSFAPGYLGRYARGTAAVPSQVLANDRISFLVGSGFGTANFINSGAINIYAEENFTDSSSGVYINFQTCSIGSTIRTEKVRITANGEVQVGSAVTSGSVRVFSTFGDRYYYIRGDSTADYGAIGARTSSNTVNTDVLVWTPQGRIGIGVTTPGSLLTVGSAADNQVFLGKSDKTHQIIGQGASGIPALEVYSQHGSDQNKIAFAVADNRDGGSKSYAFVVNGIGGVGIGITPQDASLDIKPLSNIPQIKLTQSNVSAGGDGWKFHADGPNGGDLDVIREISNVDNKVLKFFSTGNIGIGTVALMSGTPSDSSINIYSRAAFGPQIKMRGTSNDQYPIYIVTQRDRNNAACQSADTIFEHQMQGYDGSSYLLGASITAVVEGTVGINTLPTRLVFSTNPGTGGINYVVERARFTSTGYFKASNTGVYHDGGSTGTFHEFRQSLAASASLVVTQSDASYTGNLIHASSTRANSTLFNLMVLETSTFTDREFALRGDGNAYADVAWNGGGADYAEYFEWSDGNIEEKDRRGISVVLDGDKIREAQTGEDPIGVISGNPSVVGDASWNKWSGKYLRDDFGTYIREPHQVVEWEEEVLDEEEVLPVYNENDEIIAPGRPAKYKTVKHSYEDFNIPSDVVVPNDAVYKSVDENGNAFTHRKLNPDYDPNMEYVPREERHEWDCVGLMGKLRIRKGQIIGSRWIKMRDISDSVEEWLVR